MSKFINVLRRVVRCFSKSPKQVYALDMTFEDHERAFQSKTTEELIRGYLVMHMCSIDFIVQNNQKLMKACEKLMGKTIFNALMRASFYGHFVAGEDEFEIAPTLSLLRAFGVNPILDYSAEEDLTQEEAERRQMAASIPISTRKDPEDLERQKKFSIDKNFADRRLKVQSARTYFYLDEHTCERNMGTFLKCIEAAACNDKTCSGTNFAACKITALGRPQLLLQVSDVIMKARSYMSEIVGSEGNVLCHHLSRDALEEKIRQANITDVASVKHFLDSLTVDDKGIIHLFPWSGIIGENQELSSSFRVPDLKKRRMVRFTTKLSPTEEEMFRNMVRRIDTLVRAAQELNVCLMVDAEQSYFQPAISRMTLEFMRKYNKQRGLVFNTYQCYLKDILGEAMADLEQAKRQGFYFAAKLVRGAYMDQERERALALGYPDPINRDFEATSKMYHRTLSECLSRIKKLKDSGDDPKKIQIMVASHNEDTIRFTITKMKEIGIEPADKVISFGQLLAMCDYITFPLAQAGYSAYKYVPYGAVGDVLPYLSRRAQENRGVLQKVKKEKRLLIRELSRRFKSGQLWYIPKKDYVSA